MKLNQSRVTYLLLFVVSLAMPSLHFGSSHTFPRYVQSTAFSKIIDPFALMINLFGAISILVSVALLLLFAFSWKCSRLVETKTVSGVSVALYIYATAYGFICLLYLHALALSG